MSRVCGSASRWRWLLLMTAFWPVWAWYGARLCDGSDEPLGVVALATAAAVAVRRAPSAGDPMRSAPVAVFLTAYAMACPWAPEMVRAVLAVLALCAGLGWFAGCPGVWALALLSLPIESTVQFYFGYPLRLLAGGVAAALLRIGGLDVYQQGVALLWRGETVLIDAPCSGVKMLWLGGVLVSGIAAWRGLRLRQTLLLGFAALPVLLAGNALRNAALFLTETGLIPAPPWAHGPIGCAVLGGCAVLLTQLGARLKPGDEVCAHSWPAARSGLVGALCLVAALAPILGREGPGRAASGGALAWPLRLDGEQLDYRPLAPDEERFARGFPGRIAVAVAGARRVVLRQVGRPTRMLHPAADCLRGMGYAVKPLPAWRDPDDNLWARFEAAKGPEICVAREQITDGAKRTWSDVSAWYWAAALGRSRGPWLAVTVIEEAK